MPCEDRHTGTSPCGHRGSWSDTATNPGTSRTASATRSQEGARKDLPRVSEGAQPCQHLDLIRLPSGTVREQISIVSSCPVCAALLLPPQDLILLLSANHLACYESAGVQWAGTDHLNKIHRRTFASGKKLNSL